MRIAGDRDWLLMAILALSPLAYIGSLAIERSLPARTVVASINEEEALRITREFAKGRQIDTQSWESAVATNLNDKLIPVFRKVHSAPLESIASPSTILVLLRTRSRERWFRATLTPRGTVIGFQENKPLGKPEVTGLETARGLAEAYLRERLGPGNPFHLEARDPDESGDRNQDRTFTWRAPVPGAPKTTATFRVDVYGNHVTSERGSVSANAAYFNPNEGWLTFLKVLAWIYILSLGVYSIVRYWRLASDKEVSHRRSALAALGFAAMAALFAFDPGYLGGQVGAELGGDRIAVLAIMVVSYCVMGAFFGVAYGAGEGGLRKTYPGKLTSLDALLSGKVNSTNVARSILIGGGIAGWLLLVQNAVLLALHAYRVGADHDILASILYRFPLLVLVGDRAADSVLLTCFGLLLPIALLRPRIRKPWVFFGLMPLFTMLPATITAGDEALWGTFFTLQLVLVAAVLAPFFSCDLLAAVCGIFAVRFVGALIQRSAVSGAWEHIFLWQVLPAGLAFLLTEVYFAWRGPTYEDYEVRPLYARVLVEHEAMEAEIDAARLVQLRLLPAAPPRIVGLSIAASCLPAREVGGDFFDFFELDSHRLGIFLAEGGSRELGSAMPIALAKGYLLYASGLELSPAEVLRRLYETMDSALASDASLSVLYAVIDARARTIRFARTGASPRLSINGCPAVEEVAGDSDGRNAIRQGAANLKRQDALFFYTDGLAAQIAERKRQWTDQFLRKLVERQPDSPASDLLAAVVKAAIRGKQHPPDDVTSVVVRVEDAAEGAMGVVA